MKRITILLLFCIILQGCVFPKVEGLRFYIDEVEYLGVDENLSDDALQPYWVGDAVILPYLTYSRNIGDVRVFKLAFYVFLKNTNSSAEIGAASLQSVDGTKIWEDDLSNHELQFRLGDSGIYVGCFDVGEFTEAELLPNGDVDLLISAEITVSNGENTVTKVIAYPIVAYRYTTILFPT